MEKLLQWSIAQQTADKDAQEKAGQPDPKVLEQLFGGPDEPTLMKHAMAVVSNPEATEENKIVAFENFEMLVENIDNANNIENLKLWPSIISQLTSPSQDLRLLAASVISTATQNNPKSQKAFLDQDQGMQMLIEISSNSESPKSLQLKSILALASAIRNFEDGVKEFIKLGGLACLKIGSDGMGYKELLRIQSLLSAVLSTPMDSAKSDYIHNSNLVTDVLNTIRKDANETNIERTVGIISQLKHHDYNFNNAELALLREKLDIIKSFKDQLTNDNLKDIEDILS